MSYPDDNPKTAIGATKAPLHLVPPSSIHYLSLAFKDGAKKYGPYNWRDQKVSSSVYVGAAMRHIGAWWDGQNLSQDASVEHLAHVMACCAIILDAASVGMLNDDRPTAGAAPDLQAEFASGGVCGQHAMPKQHRRVATAAELAAYGIKPAPHNCIEDEV